MGRSLHTRNSNFAFWKLKEPNMFKKVHWHVWENTETKASDFKDSKSL